MGHELTVTLPPQPIIVDADPTRLAQVFSNLLNNAAKYTERGGHIWLTAERQGSDVVVSVQGHRHRHRRRPAAPHLRDVLAGGPVAGAVAGRAGHRADAGEAAGRDARRPVEARSEGPGKGQRVRRPPAGRRRRRPGRRPAAETDEPAGPKSSLRILVVDDNRDAADSLAMLLRIMGNDIRTAHDGQEAVEAAEEFRPDVVLLDIGLPKLNGYEACRRIREQPWGKERGPDRPDRLGAGGGPPPLAGGRVRPPHGQAGGPAALMRLLAELKVAKV